MRLTIDFWDELSATMLHATIHLAWHATSSIIHLFLVSFFLPYFTYNAFGPDWFKPFSLTYSYNSLKAH